jgi:hypothetical protein
MQIMRRHNVPEHVVVIENFGMVVRDDLAVLIAGRRGRHDHQDR